MPTRTKTTPAQTAKAYQLVSVVGPTAGMDLRSAQTLLAVDRARTLLNFSLTNPGELLVRPGWRQFSTSALSSVRAQGAARIYLNTAIPSAASTIFTAIVTSGSLYIQSDNGAWLSTTAALTGLSSNQVSFVADRDLVAVLDGSTALWKSTTASSWTHFGIRTGSTFSVSSASSGAMSSGEYEFNFTYKDRDQAFESNGGTASTITLSGTTGAMKLVIPNSTDAQVDALVVYARKVSAGETVRRKASSQAQSAGASSTIVLTSTAWTTADEEPTDHTYPGALSFGVVWKNRWWARDAVVTNRLHFTQLFQPQSWPALFYIDMPFAQGDSIQAIIPAGDTLLIFGTTTIFQIIGQTSLDFEVRPTLTSEDGAFGFRAVCRIENGVVHIGANGVFIFDGGTDRLLSFDLDPAWRDLVTNGSQADLNKIAVTYHQQQKELRIAVPRRYPSGTWGEWILDLNRTRLTGNPAWSASDRPIGGYVLWDGPETVSGNRGRLFSWSATQTLLNEEATGTTANGADLHAEYEGPGLSLGALRGQWIDGRLEYEPHAGSLSCEVVVDGQSKGTQPIAIGAGLALYGSAVYGTATYGGTGRRMAYVMFPVSADGHSFVWKLTYTGKEAWRGFAYHIGVVPETTPSALGA